MLFGIPFEFYLSRKTKGMLSRGNWLVILSQIGGVEYPQDLDIVVRKLGQKMKIVIKCFIHRPAKKMAQDMTI
jgi:hypothetical protein